MFTEATDIFLLDEQIQKPRGGGYFGDGRFSDLHNWPSITFVSVDVKYLDLRCTMAYSKWPE